MSAAPNRPPAPPWLLIGAAASLLALTMGSRSSFGLLLSPLNTATGLGLATISFAVATSQLAWGFAQPLAGMLADRYGTARVIAGGALLLAAATALLPLATGEAALVAVFALIAAGGAGAGSNALLLGTVNQRVDPARRGLAAGIVGAGGSAGQLLLGPLTQGAIEAAGWVAASLGLAALALLALPLARAFPGTPAAPATPAATGDGTVRACLRRPAFWLVSGGIFVCGFHVAFLITHMPGVIAACALPAGLAGAWLALAGVANIAGSLGAGLLVQRVSPLALLMSLYALRGLGVALFLAAPKTPAVMLGFALWMGLTYMATLPPTTALVARIAGGQRLATLFGVVMAVHQLGAFLGAWAGGLAIAATGSYTLIWLVDIALAAVAVMLHLPLLQRAGRARGLAPARA